MGLKATAMGLTGALSLSALPQQNAEAIVAILLRATMFAIDFVASILL